MTDQPRNKQGNIETAALSRDNKTQSESRTPFLTCDDPKDTDPEEEKPWECPCCAMPWGL